MAENTQVKKYYNEAGQTIDEQAILDKYNAATVAQFNVQREQNRQAENNFYNQMYNTQRTAMDTIRQANANAVSTGASKGVQAANELSALLGLQSESVASATELAQANRQTAQEETAAVLENVLQAYQQAQQEKAQYVQHAIESASVDVQSDSNKIAAKEMANTEAMNLQTVAAEGIPQFAAAAVEQGKDFTQGSVEGQQYLATNLNALSYTTVDDFGTALDRGFGGTNSGARTKYGQTVADIQTLCNIYGIPFESLSEELTALSKVANTNEGSVLFGIGGTTRDTLKVRYNAALDAIKTKIISEYSKKLTKGNANNG